MIERLSHGKLELSAKKKIDATIVISVFAGFGNNLISFTVSSPSNTCLSDLIITFSFFGAGFAILHPYAKPTPKLILVSEPLDPTKRQPGVWMR